MSAQTYDAAMVRVFADEGGYTNDPQDPGGATNWGITIFDARKYWKADASPSDVKAMPKSVAVGIYRKHYADPLRYDDLPAGFDYSVLDAGINSGVARAVPWAGKALRQPVKTIADVVPMAQGATDKVDLIQRYWAIRLAFLQGLPTWSHFARGWGRRCTQGEAAAVRMWLTIGAKLTPSEINVRMGQEADKAKGKAKKATTGAAGSAGAPAIPGSQIDLSGLTGKVLLAALIAIGIGAAIYFLRQAKIHNDRAAAYAA
jgi:lysozyme family protein